MLSLYDLQEVLITNRKLGPYLFNNWQLSLFKLSVFKVFEYVTIVVLLPLLVSLLDPLGHLLERGLEHRSELLTHLVNLSLQPCDLINFILFYDLVPRLQLLQVLIQLLNLCPVFVLLALQLVSLGYELLEAGLVLAGHVRHDVPLPALLVLEQLLQLQIPVSLLVLRGLRLVRHLLLHD